MASHGKARQAGLGRDWLGRARLGGARHGRQGSAWQGMARYGKAGLGWVRHGRRGKCYEMAGRFLERWGPEGEGSPPGHF